MVVLFGVCVFPVDDWLCCAVSLMEGVIAGGPAGRGPASARDGVMTMGPSLLCSAIFRNSQYMAEENVQVLVHFIGSELAVDYCCSP
jgi:hypothetical protein